MTIDIFKLIADERAGLIAEVKPHLTSLIALAFDGLKNKLEKVLEIDYVGDLYRTDYVVTGTGAFPIDMLRYTCSWPMNEADVDEIESSIEIAGATDPFQVSLTKYHRDPEPELAEDRWQSKYRWLVVKQLHTVKL